MNEMFKDLLTVEQKYTLTPLNQRRQLKKKPDAKEELREVMNEVQDIEGAVFKCCEIAKFAIEKYDNLASKH